MARRKLSAAQRKAGFGGKRAMSGSRSSKRGRPRRSRSGGGSFMARRRTVRWRRPKRSGSPKRPSVSKLAAIGGIAAITTTIGAELADTFVDGVADLSREAGLGIKVTGATIVLATAALRGAAAVSPWFGAKYRGFLAGYGLRP